MSTGSYDLGSSKRLGFPLPDVSLPVLAPYWEGAGLGELRLPFCAACGACRWYPTDTCAACSSASTVIWRALSGRATVFSFTVVHHLFLPQYRDLVPFVAALVVPDEALHARVATRLVDLDDASMCCGLRVVARFEPLIFAGVEGSVMAPVFAPDREELS